MLPGKGLMVPALSQAGLLGSGGEVASLAGTRKGACRLQHRRPRLWSQHTQGGSLWLQDGQGRGLPRSGGLARVTMEELCVWGQPRYLQMRGGGGGPEGREEQGWEGTARERRQESSRHSE